MPLLPQPPNSKSKDSYDLTVLIDALQRPTWDSVLFTNTVSFTDIQQAHLRFSLIENPVSFTDIQQVHPRFQCNLGTQCHLRTSNNTTWDSVLFRCHTREALPVLVLFTIDWPTITKQVWNDNVTRFCYLECLSVKMVNWGNSWH